MESEREAARAAGSLDGIKSFVAAGRRTVSEHGAGRIDVEQCRKVTRRDVRHVPQHGEDKTGRAR